MQPQQLPVQLSSLLCKGYGKMSLRAFLKLLELHLTLSLFRTPNLPVLLVLQLAHNRAGGIRAVEATFSNIAIDSCFV